MRGAPRVLSGLGAALVLAAIALAGCDALPGKPTRAERPELPSSVMDFASLYGTNCAGCHGADGRFGAARSLNDPLYLALVDDETLHEIVARGVEDTTMPAFATDQGGMLTEEQIGALVREMRQRWARPQEVASVSLPPYSASPGDAQRGVAAYATYCASCHGDDGTGGTARGSIVDGSFLALVSDQSLRTTVIVGRADLGMPDFRGEHGTTPMSEQQIADVIAWLVSKRTPFPGQPFPEG